MGRKIVFKHRRAVGDALMLTSGIRDFKLLFPNIVINVDNNFSDLWENNPYIDRTIKKGQEGVEYYPVGYPAIQTCNNGYTHFANSFLLDMIAQADAHSPLGISVGEYVASFSNGGEKTLGSGPGAKEPFISWRKKYNNFCQTAFRQWGDIHLTEKEKTYNMIEEVYGVQKYWVIAPGGKSDATTKIWDWRRFQKVVDHFDGLLKFVVIGRSDHRIEKLNNVISLVDKTKIRDLIPLVYHADGCVSGVSFLMHLAAAMPSRTKRSRKPCVSIYGGREPTSFTWYCNHQVLHTNGAISCCDSGGCWQSRVIPEAKDPDKNNRLCMHTVKRDERTVPLCMDMITGDDIIRAIEKYYSGNIYSYMKPEKGSAKERIDQVVNTVSDAAVEPMDGKEINVLASLKSKGGGEQSACKIVELLEKDGWKVNFYPWAKVHDNYRTMEDYKNIDIKQESFSDGRMLETMKPGLPLLFYANDQIWDFCDQDKAEGIIEKSSEVIIGVNYCNGTLPKSGWLSKSGKVKAVIFQNEEKKDEFFKDAIGFEDTQLIVLFGAIRLDKFLEVPQRRKEGNNEIVILKHCTPDYRKYVTSESVNNGQRIHVWQKNIIKEDDVKFYSRLIADMKNVRFEFMEAHKEIVSAFKNNPKFTFHKWDSMPVTEFLKRGHIYLYRTSNLWRDQYPRVVAEALAAGLPVVTEPRDGTKDRVVHGNTGFYAIDYDGFLYALKILQRKENLRFEMGKEAKSWAKQNLDPRKWVDVINGLLVKK
jgi:ADP-heptose:LPS heptosyltransferase